MTTHPRSFDIQNALPASEVMDRLNLAPEAAPLQKTSKPRWLRKLLLTGASLIALAGAAHFGYGYWSVGRFDQDAAHLLVGPCRRTSARPADLLCNFYHDHFPNSC